MCKIISWHFIAITQQRTVNIIYFVQIVVVKRSFNHLNWRFAKVYAEREIQHPKFCSKIGGDFGFYHFGWPFCLFTMRSTQIFEIIYVWNGVLFTKMLHECVCMSLFIIIAQMIVSLISLFSLILLLWFDLNVMHIQFVFVKISYIIILYFIFVFVSDNGCHMIPKAFSWNFCLR